MIASERAQVVVSRRRVHLQLALGALAIAYGCYVTIAFGWQQALVLRHGTGGLLLTAIGVGGIYRAFTQVLELSFAGDRGDLIELRSLQSLRRISLTEIESIEPVLNRGTSWTSLYRKQVGISLRGSHARIILGDCDASRALMAWVERRNEAEVARMS